MGERNFKIRAAVADDAAAIANVHVESIRSLGHYQYAPAIVADWGRPRGPEQYVHAMGTGELFFVAISPQASEPLRGFSSYRIEEARHRTAVYVGGACTRTGIGSALFQAAESAARTNGAKTLDVDASLSAVEFYAANGFVPVGRGQHRLRSGVLMDCVFMQKWL